MSAIAALTAPICRVRPSNELRAVASGDPEALFAEQRFPDFDLPVVALRVDHVDAGGGYGQEVDVGSGSRQPAVGEHGNVRAVAG